MLRAALRLWAIAPILCPLHLAWTSPKNNSMVTSTPLTVRNAES
jgi:hypothetical protein